MATKEIPPQQWESFFDMFSRKHQGWRVTVEVLGDEIGAELEAKEMPLEGITADTKDKNHAISIILREKGAGHLTHIVSEPRYVRLKQAQDGADEALAIESLDRVTTLVRFRSAMLPEMLDGVLS
jgi:hypothetical protein